MNFIGWTPDRGSGSSWKFRPRGQLRLNESITIHEPHPDATQRINQVRWTGSRLKRMCKLLIKLFILLNDELTTLICRWNVDEYVCYGVR